MPAKFKGMATLGAWVLFIQGLLGLLFGWIVFFMKMAAGPIDATEMPAWCAVNSAFLLGGVLITLSVCIMILRRKLE